MRTEFPPAQKALRARDRRAAICLLILVESIACTRGPKGLSRPAYLATEKAVASLNRANEYRDADVLVYEPRFLDAQKAIDELAAAASKPADTSVAMIARACADELKLHRQNLDNHRDIKDMAAIRKKVTAEIDACIGEARSYLQ